MIKNGKKKFLFFGLAAAMALFTTGCGSATDDGTTGNNEAGTGEEVTDGETNETVGRDRVVVAQGGDATSLDLHAANDSPSSQITSQIFETLVRQDANMEIIPGLATEWRKVDDRTWEFDIKQGVTFHNGEPLTAHDVAFTFKRATASPSVVAIVGEIDPEGIEVVDEYTVRIATFEPFAPILAHLAHTASGIMSEAAVTALEEAGENVGQNPVGTGPFQFVSWTTGDNIVLERFDGYHGDKPVFRELVFRVITETPSRYIELETQGVDIALGIGPSDIPRFDSNPDLNLLRESNFSTAYIGFNMNVAPFDNVLVRRAINYAINVESIVEHVLDGFGEVANGPLGQNVFGAHPNLPANEFNIERAKELMAEAGFEDGFETTIWTNENTERVQIITAIQAMLREIGITAHIEQMEWGSYLDRTARGEHEMFILGWVSVTGDADYGLFPLFHSSVSAEAGNRTFFANDEVDRLLEAGRATTDPEERLAIYAEVQEIIVEEAPWIFLTTGETAVGTQADIRGLELSPSQHHQFSTVYFE